MDWYEVELEIPIYGKNFETIQVTDAEMNKKTVSQYNIYEQSIYISKIKI